MAKKKDETEVQEVETVRMVRSEEYPEPRTADVHKDEVDNWKEFGWVEA